MWAWLKQKSADLLFAVQFLAMIFLTGSQCLRMLKSVEGISPVWPICLEVFSLINVSLAYRGWKQTPHRETKRLLITHASWIVANSLLLALLIKKASEVGWAWYDTVTSVLVVVIAGITMILAEIFSTGIEDPLVRGVIGATFRGIPHLAMAYKIQLSGGGHGLAPLMVVMAHLTVISRLCQLGLAIRESGFQRVQKSLLLADGVNWASWIVVTIVWCLH